MPEPALAPQLQPHGVGETLRPAGCRCPDDRADLFTRIDGGEQPVRRHSALGGVEALYRARCRACGCEFLGHWRLARPAPRAVPSWPDPPARQETLW